MQSVHDFVTSFFQAAVTQGPAADTKDNTGQETTAQQTTTISPIATQEFPIEGGNEQIDEDQQWPSPEPAVTQSQLTIAALQEEIEFLKQQVRDYQEEAERVREVYQSEYNLHILAKVASAEERTKSEFMCSECAELFTTVGYKVVEVPLTGVIPESSIIEEKGEEETDKPVATQEPAGPPEAVIDKPAVTQEPASSPEVLEEQTDKPAVTQEPAGSSKSLEEEIDKPAVTQEPAGSPKALEEKTDIPAVTQEPAGSPKSMEEETDRPAVTQEPAGSPATTEEEKGPSAITQEPADSLETAKEEIKLPAATQEPAGSPVTVEEEEVIVIQEQSAEEQG